VVTREAAHAEGIAGGFSAVYDVLKSMEEAGRVRRGYFVAGRGGTQFAIPGADERLRAVRDGDGKEGPPLVLAATDPANPFGALLEWPARDGGEGARPQRAAGALVVLHEGALLGWLGRTEQSLLTFLPAEEPARAAAARTLSTALGGLVGPGKRRALLITSIDGAPAAESPLAPCFMETGFERSARGLLKRASAALGTSASDPIDHDETASPDA
jgi:ATP-dependent Lhr-like helicase